eukprot:1758685-Amphidinium_carterae.1
MVAMQLDVIGEQFLFKLTDQGLEEKLYSFLESSSEMSDTEEPIAEPVPEVDVPILGEEEKMKNDGDCCWRGIVGLLDSKPGLMRFDRKSAWSAAP